MASQSQLSQTTAEHMDLIEDTRVKSSDPVEERPILLALPAEIYNKITGNLSILDLQTLRLTCQFFKNLVPEATHYDWLCGEKDTHDPVKFNYFTCACCRKPQHASKFSSGMKKKKHGINGTKAFDRFCNPCGTQNSKGVHRYTRGARWDDGGVLYVCCIRCSRKTLAPLDLSVQSCLSCHKILLRRSEQANTEAERAEKAWNEAATTALESRSFSMAYASDSDEYWEKAQRKDEYEYSEWHADWYESP